MKQYTVSTALQPAIQRLRRAGCETPRLDAEIILAHALGKERTWLYIYPQAGLDPAQKNQFLDLIARREQREPVAYITGRKEFFSLEFLVNRHVLIPRPETELLVEKVLQHAKERDTLSISLADVGTGSGCIAVTLAKHLAKAFISAIDISPQALQVARQNVRRHHVTARVALILGDLLRPCKGPFDIIVSNPPYIGRAELAMTPPEVRQYEPRSALAGGQDGLEIIDQLLAQVRETLKPGGCFLMEMGATQSQATISLARGYFPKAKICLQRDLAGLDRILRVERPIV